MNRDVDRRCKRRLNIFGGLNVVEIHSVAKVQLDQKLF